MTDILTLIDRTLAECAEPTLGDQAVTWVAEHLDVTLFPWQEDILRRYFR
jgi:hypothetical protein